MSCPATVTTVIHAYLEAIGATFGRPERVRQTREMFEYICAHQAWLRQHPRLRSVIQAKLVELHVRDGWGEAAWYHRRLFGPSRTQLPGRL